MEANHTTVNVIINLKFHGQYLIIFLPNVGGNHQNNPGDTGVNWTKRGSSDTIRVERSGLKLSFHSFKSYFSTLVYSLIQVQAKSIESQIVPVHQI